MIVEHIPTGKKHKVLKTVTNKYGQWHLTIDNVWLYAADCNKITDGRK